MTSSRKTALVTGYGYTGSRLAQRLQSTDWTVCVLARDASQVARATHAGHQVLELDLDNESSLHGRSMSCDIVVHLVPPPAHGHADNRVRALLRHLNPPPHRKLILISTTGVYGDHGGTVVTEQTAINPTTPRAVRRADAEQAVKEYGARCHVPVHVLRVPGIYGPGRLPIDRLRRGDPLPPAADCSYTSRIHVDDLVTAIITLCDCDKAGPVYNISDGVAMNSRAWRELVADEAGLPYPPEISWDEAQTRLPAKTLSFLRESRKIDSSLIRSELGLRLAFDNPIDGIRDAMRVDTQ